MESDDGPKGRKHVAYIELHSSVGQYLTFVYWILGTQEDGLHQVYFSSLSTNNLANVMSRH